MKKNLLVAIIMMAVVLVGCGKDTSTTINHTEPTVEAEVETITSESIESTGESNKDKEIPEGEIDSNKDSLNLKEYEDVFEDRDIDTNGAIVIHYESFNPSDIIFYYLKDSVDLYIDNGKCIGYTKPDVEISVIGENEDWYLINVDGNDRYAKIDDVKAVGFAGNKSEYLASQKEDSQKTEPIEVSEQSGSVASSSASDEVVAESPTEQTPAPAESDKYTPDEAIAVYRSLMEAGGITWDPSLKGVTSWGTGWIYLDKGMPEWTASANLESYAMGDTVGNPSTKFYFEVTGSDENAVYITEWNN